MTHAALTNRQWKAAQRNGTNTGKEWEHHCEVIQTTWSIERIHAMGLRQASYANLPEAKHEGYARLFGERFAYMLNQHGAITQDQYLQWGSTGAWSMHSDGTPAD